MPGPYAVSVDDDPRTSQIITKEINNEKKFNESLERKTTTVRKIVGILTQAQSDTMDTLFTGTNQTVIVNIINKIRDLLDTLTKEEEKQLIDILLLPGFQEKVTQLKPNTIDLLIDKIKESKKQRENPGASWSSTTNKKGGRRKSTRRKSKRVKSYRKSRKGRKKRSRRYR